MIASISDALDEVKAKEIMEAIGNKVLVLLQRLLNLYMEVTGLMLAA